MAIGNAPIVSRAPQFSFFCLIPLFSLQRTVSRRSPASRVVKFSFCLAAPSQLVSDIYVLPPAVSLPFCLQYVGLFPVRSVLVTKQPCTARPHISLVWSPFLEVSDYLRALHVFLSAPPVPSPANYCLHLHIFRDPVNASACPAHPLFCTSFAREIRLLRLTCSPGIDSDSELFSLRCSAAPRDHLLRGPPPSDLFGSTPLPSFGAENRNFFLV